MAGNDGILETFWGLASLEETERVQAAHQLLTTLLETQAGCEEGVCSNELEYCTQRLVRGLASNRKGARHGYFMALTELLSIFPVPSLGALLELIHANLEPAGGVKAMEARGVYFGQVFALLAIIKSGRLSHKDDILKVVERLCVCGNKKPYLAQFCAVSVAPLLDDCLDDVSRDHVISLLGLDRAPEQYTPETLFFAVLLSKAHRQSAWLKKLFKRHWKCKYIVDPANFTTMATILVESSSAHPHLHCVWQPLLDAVLHTQHFSHFWRTVVDNGLFNSSHERKYLGFKLLESILPNVTSSEVEQVLSPNLLHCLVNNASASGNYLHPAARHLITELAALMLHCGADIAIAMYTHLNRNVRGFDKLTHSSLSADTLARLDAPEVSQLITHLQDLFCAPTSINSTNSADEPEGAHTVQLWVLDEMLAVVRNGKIPRKWVWLLDVSKFLLFHAFFTADKPHPLLPKLPKVPLERSIRENCIQKFNSVLADLSNLALQIDKESGVRYSQPGVMDNGELYLSNLLLFAQELLTTKCCSLAEPFTEQVAVTWSKAVEVVQSLVAKELTNGEKALVLLLSASSLQLLPPAERNSNNTEELCVCYTEMQQALTKTPKKKKRVKSSSVCDPPGWMEVLTDVLLSALSSPSQLWRGVVQQAFRLVVGYATLDSLRLILGVLEPKQSKEDLMEESGEASEDGEGGDSGEGGEASEDGEPGDSDEDGDSGEGGEASEDDSEVSSEGGEGVDPAFRAEVRKALGTAAVNSDQEESDSSLDDEAMMAVDEALAAAFRTRLAMTQLNRKKKGEAKSVLHFKLRVLDLVEIFIRKEATNPLVLDLLVPLYRLIQSCHNKANSAPLLTRASVLYRNKLCRPKEYPKMGVDGEYVHSQLQELFQCMYKAPSQLAPLLSQGCLFLIRVLLGNQAPPTISPLTTRSARKRKLNDVPKQSHGLLNVTMVTECFSDALHDFITKKNTNVHQGLFTSYAERQPNLAWLLLVKIAEDLPSSANLFRKVQVYEILDKLFATKPADTALLSASGSTIQSHCIADIGMATKLTKPVKLARALVKMLLKLVKLLKSCDEPLLNGRGLEDTLTTLTASHPTLRSDLGNDLERLTKELTSLKLIITPTKKRK